MTLLVAPGITSNKMWLQGLEVSFDISRSSPQFGDQFSDTETELIQDPPTRSTSDLVFPHGPSGPGERSIGGNAHDPREEVRSICEERVWGHAWVNVNSDHPEMVLFCIVFVEFLGRAPARGDGQMEVNHVTYETWAV